jgi:Flp pilus assembly protein TadG
LAENAGKRPNCRTRTGDDRGAALVELAIALPILIVFLFAIVDFGFTFNDWMSVRQGGRDGLRQAIVNTTPTAPGGGTWSCTTAGFTGTAPAAGSSAMNMVCFVKARVGLDPSNTRVKIYFASTYTAGQPVKVCVQYKASSRTGAFSGLLNSRVLSTEVESLIEQDDPTMAPVEETPIAGGPGWSASCGTV